MFVKITKNLYGAFFRANDFFFDGKIISIELGGAEFQKPFDRYKVIIFDPKIALMIRISFFLIRIVFTVYSVKILRTFMGRIVVLVSCVREILM